MTPRTSRNHHVSLSAVDFIDEHDVIDRNVREDTATLDRLRDYKHFYLTGNR